LASYAEDSRTVGADTPASWGLQVQKVLLWRIHACVIPEAGRSFAEGPLRQ